MSRNGFVTRPGPRWSTRRLVGVLVMAVIAAGSLAPAGAAAAADGDVAGDHHSPVVVREANEALQLLQRYRADRTAQNLRRYRLAKNEAARATARQLGVSEDAMVRAWFVADRRHQVAVLSALTQLGVPYRRNSSRPGIGFDCSGLTAFAWRRAGVTLSRVSSDQIDDASRRRQSTADAGDLVHYPGHVMLYLGVGRAIVHASNPRDDVELAFIAAGRTLRWGDPSS